jgi:MFS family permease
MGENLKRQGDGAKSVRPIIVTASVVAFSLLGDSFLYVALPLEYSALGLSLVSVGVLLSVNRFIRFFSNTAAGYVYGRYNVKPSLVAAIIVGALVNLSYGFVAGFLTFLVARAIWGVVWSFLRLGGFLTVMTRSETERRGRNLGLYQSIASLGSLFGSLLGGYLLDTLGFRSAAILLGCGSILGIPVALSLRDNEGVHDVGMGERAPLDLSLLLGDSRMLSVGLGTMMNSLLLGSLLASTLSLYLLESLGEGRLTVLGVPVGIATLSGALLMIRLGSRFVVGPLFGGASDRLGRGITITTLFIGGILGMATLGLSVSPVTVTLAVVLCFVSASGLGVVLTAEASDFAASKGGVGRYVMSAFTNWVDLGSALGPLLAYVLRLGIPFRTMYLGSSFILLAYTLFRNFMRSRQEPHQAFEI